MGLDAVTDKMTDTYYTHEFEQHDGTFPPEDADEESPKQPEKIKEYPSLYRAISRAKTAAANRYGIDSVDTTICENGDILFYERGQPGGYRVRSTDDWQEYQPLEPSREGGSPSFGERNDIGNPYAKARITVERETEGYSDLTEVFSFRFLEPNLTEADRDPKPRVKFSLVNKSQNGTMDLGDEVYGQDLIPLKTVPESVRERASAMLDWAEVTVEDSD